MNGIVYPKDFTSSEEQSRQLEEHHIERLPEHSVKMQAVLGRPPHWLILWGNTMFILLILLLFTAMWWIRYPDVITAPFLLSSANAPRRVVARTEGRLEKLSVADGELVKRGQIIGYSESTGNPKQILRLEEQIDDVYRLIMTDDWGKLNVLVLSTFDTLGEIQLDFQTFHQELLKLQAVLADGYYTQKRHLLIEDQNDLTQMDELINEQLTIQNQDLELAADEFRIQSKLHDNKVISSVDFMKERAKLLAREMPVKSLKSAKIQNQSARKLKQKELLELDATVRSQKLSFHQSIQTLKSSIQTWKNKYLIFAPVDGKISFSEPWQERQFLNAGQELMTVEPLHGKYLGLVKLPQPNLGKLREGQTVLIKLDGYPFREYGILEGSLAKLSITPGSDSAFWGYVTLPNKLVTKHGHQLPFRNGMKGSAEIITSDRNLLQRLFAIFRPDNF